VQTANGATLAAAVVIDRLAIGSIERRRVAALVAQPGMLDQSLLGLNFLNSLQSFTVSGRQMILTP
jgi:aspartyl protease family protein